MNGMSSLRKPGEDGALLALVHGARAQDTLHVGLVHAPIEHSAKQVPDEEAGDGKLGIERLHHMEEPGIDARGQAAPSANGDKGRRW